MKTLTKRKKLIVKDENQVGFHFDPIQHVYTLDGKPLHGVTSILKVIAKPLTWWASGMALTELGWTNPKFVSREEGVKIAGKARKNFFITNEQYYDWLQECYGAHNRIKEEAGSAGTDVHTEIEKLVKYAIQFGEGRLIGTNSDNPQVQKFVAWAIENKVRFLESEKMVYSRESWYAGTLDIILEVDGKKYIADIKTSSAIYPEAYLQMAAYQSALEEMGEHTDIAGSVVINLPKKGGFAVGYNYDYEGNRMAFLAALVLYKQLQSIT